MSWGTSISTGPRSISTVLARTPVENCPGSGRPGRARRHPDARPSPLRARSPGRVWCAASTARSGRPPPPLLRGPHQQLLRQRRLIHFFLVRCQVGQRVSLGLSLSDRSDKPGPLVSDSPAPEAETPLDHLQASCAPPDSGCAQERVPMAARTSWRVLSAMSFCCPVAGFQD